MFCSYSVDCPHGIQLQVESTNLNHYAHYDCIANGNLLQWSVNGEVITIPGGAPVGTLEGNINLPGTLAVLLKVGCEMARNCTDYQGKRTSVLRYDPSSLGPGVITVTCGRISANMCSTEVSVGK